MRFRTVTLACVLWATFSVLLLLNVLRPLLLEVIAV